jgi:hypothetical protein
MAVASKLLKGLSEETILWLRSLSRKLKESYARATTPEEIVEETVGDRLRNLQETAPEMFRLYQDLPLYHGLSSPDLDLGLIDPERFKTLAAPLPMQNPLAREEIYSNIKEIQDLVEAGIPLSDIPYLRYSPEGKLQRQAGIPSPEGKLQSIVSHEGRHRNRALEGLGYQDSLVEFSPYGALPLKSLPPETRFAQQEWSPTDSKVLSPALKDFIKILSVPAALSQIPEGATYE